MPTLMPLPLWEDISYLKSGNPTQRKTWEILHDTQILKLLYMYHPIVIGTIPIDIDIPGSDIDIACEVDDHCSFIEVLTHHFPTVSITQRSNVSIGRMHIGNMEIEVYGERMPVSQQDGFVHMVVEARLLQLGGQRLRDTVRALKQGGLKTEPAFAKALSISGDPYEELLKLSDFSNKQLEERFFRGSNC